MVAETDTEDEPEFKETIDRWVDRVYGATVKPSKDKVGNGVLCRKNNRTFWVSEDALERELDDLPVPIRENFEKRSDLAYIDFSSIEGIEELPRGRAHKFLRALDRNLGSDRYKLEYDPEVESAYAHSADVPVWLAAQGKYYVAAWLAAHGHPNGQIAHALDVSESTIKVNLSKFKNRDE